MMAADPTPPTLEELTGEEQAARALAVLGCAPIAESTARRAYDALMAHYQTQRGKSKTEPLRLVPLANSLGIPRTTLQMSIEKLLRLGAIVQAGRGVYVPVPGRRPN